MTWNKPMSSRPVVAVAGATGAVGQEFMEVLHDLDFPASEIRALASARSAGKKIPFKGAGDVPAGDAAEGEAVRDGVAAHGQTRHQGGHAHLEHVGPGQ